MSKLRVQEGLFITIIATQTAMCISEHFFCLRLQKLFNINYLVSFSQPPWGVGFIMTIVTVMSLSLKRRVRHLVNNSETRSVGTVYMVVDVPLLTHTPGFPLL